MSVSETWYAVKDHGTNYCNLYNLMEGKNTAKLRKPATTQHLQFPLMSVESNLQISTGKHGALVLPCHVFKISQDGFIDGTALICYLL